MVPYQQFYAELHLWAVVTSYELLRASSMLINAAAAAATTTTNATTYTIVSGVDNVDKT